MTASSILVRAAAACAALCIAAAAVAQTAPNYRLRDIEQRPLLWPDTVATTTPLSDGRNTFEAGTEIGFRGFDRQGPLVQFPGDDGLTLLDWSMIDLVDRANAIAAQMPEEMRDLTVPEIAMRTDLWPQVVHANQTIDFPDRTIDAGDDIGPYTVTRLPDGSHGIVALDPAILETGVLHQRQSYALEYTDFLAQVRDRVRSGEALAGRHIAEEFAGRLVDAAGEPAPDATAETEYFALYFSASWCGWCAKFNPTIAQFAEEAAKKHPEVRFVYMSNDDSAEDMYGHMQKAGLPFDALRYDARRDSRYLLGLVSGSTPHLIVLAADGRIVHDGYPAGMNGANAALAALRRELAAKGR